MSDETDNWPLLQAFRAARSGLTLEEQTATPEHRVGFRAAQTLKRAMAKPRAPYKPRAKRGDTTKMPRTR